MYSCKSSSLHTFLIFFSESLKLRSISKKFIFAAVVVIKKILLCGKLAATYSEKQIYLVELSNQTLFNPLVRVVSEPAHKMLCPSKLPQPPSLEATLIFELQPYFHRLEKSSSMITFPFHIVRSKNKIILLWILNLENKYHTTTCCVNRIVSSLF
jgi:hypothetical protein